MKFHKVLLRKMTLLTPPLYILNRAWKANAVACSTYTRHDVYTCVSLTHAQSRRSTPTAPELTQVYYARVYVRDDRICSYDARNQRTMPFHLSVLTLKIRFKSMFLRELLMLILTVCVNCQPTLEPPTGLFCPEVNVTYTCHDSLVMAMTWFAEPYFSGNQGIKYAPVTITNEERRLFLFKSNQFQCKF